MGFLNLCDFLFFSGVALFLVVGGGWICLVWVVFCLWRFWFLVWWVFFFLGGWRWCCSFVCGGACLVVWVFVFFVVLVLGFWLFCAWIGVFFFVVVVFVFGFGRVMLGVVLGLVLVWFIFLMRLWVCLISVFGLFSGVFGALFVWFWVLLLGGGFAGCGVWFLLFGWLCS